LETPYKAVSFVKHDTITRDVLDQLNFNYRWIQENTPRSRFYRDQGEPRPENGVLLAGKTKILENKQNDTARVNVSFSRAFAPTCRPAITTGVCADFQKKIFCVVSGPGGSNYPTASGFRVVVNVAADHADQDHIKKTFWVHWSAFGYREETVNEF
jgi:hypothetical protein